MGQKERRGMSSGQETVARYERSRHPEAMFRPGGHGVLIDHRGNDIALWEGKQSMAQEIDRLIRRPIDKVHI